MRSIFKLCHRQIGTWLCFWLTILNDWEICNSAFCVWDYYYIENRAVWVVFSCLNVVRAHLLSVLMAIIFLSRLRLRRAITSGSTPFMENDLANVSLYAMPLSLGQFWSFKNIVSGLYKSQNYGKWPRQCFTVYYASIAGTLLELLVSVKFHEILWSGFFKSQNCKTLVSLHLFTVAIR